MEITVPECDLFVSSARKKLMAEVSAIRLAGDRQELADQ